MGKFAEWLGFQQGKRGLSEILSSYELLSFADGSVPVVVDKEIGSSSPSPITGNLMHEYNLDLRGVNGIKKYNEMRRSDTAVSSTLRVIKMPIVAARWFVVPADDSEESKYIADFVWNNFSEEMSITWTQVVVEALLSLNYGWYAFEKVWTVVDKHPITGKRQIILKKLAPRHPIDVKKINYDETGGPKDVIMYKRAGTDGYETEEVTIPIEKLAVITNERESGSIEGTSILRPAYKNWFYKDIFLKIDAIQKERHGIGIPVIFLPPGSNENDKKMANELGRNLRSNERAHVVLPPNWRIEFAQISGQPVDAMKSVEYHDRQIRENVLAGFISSVESTKEEDVDIMLQASRLFADNLCETFNRYVIPQLVDANFKVDKYPRLKVRRIGEQAEWRVVSFALRNAIGSGVIRPDDELERWMRDYFDLPKADVTTTRVVASPQAAPATPATTPNQSVNGQGGVPGVTKGPFGLPDQAPVAKPKSPNANSGVDKGGQS